MAPPISWTDERIKEGLRRFYEENGRYPTAREFDRCPYLPTARQIQRKFTRGLPEFREKFALDGQYNFTTGAVRSAVAKRNLERAYSYEEDFFFYLLKSFPEYLVHEQKRLRPGNIACDFFVFLSEKSGAAIDLFYAMDVWCLARIVNIKLKRYKLLPANQKIYLISVSNHFISQIDIDRMMEGRKSRLPENIKVLSEEEFKRNLKRYLKKELN